MTMLADTTTATRFVDPVPIRAHILALEAAGMDCATISTHAGCPEPTILRIAAGGFAGELEALVLRETAERILLIPVELTVLQSASHRPGQGARRRIQALGAMGWSITLLANALGIPEHSLEAVLSTPLISARKERSIDALFEHLWATPAPENSPEEQLLKVCTLARAEAEGWVSALGWDDIDTDHEPAPTPPVDEDLVDEIAVELAITGVRIDLNRLELDAAIQRLRDQGYKLTDIAERLRCSVSTAWRGQLGDDDDDLTPVDQAIEEHVEITDAAELIEVDAEAAA